MQSVHCAQKKILKNYLQYCFYFRYFINTSNNMKASCKAACFHEEVATADSCQSLQFLIHCFFNKTSIFNYCIPRIAFFSNHCLCSRLIFQIFTLLCLIYNAFFHDKCTV